MRVEEVEELLQRSEHNGFPVVESLVSRHLVGFVSRMDLIKALGKHSSLPLFGKRIFRLYLFWETTTFRYKNHFSVRIKAGNFIHGERTGWAGSTKQTNKSFILRETE